MLKPTECLVWDGLAFRPVSYERPILPNGARLMPGAVSPGRTSAEALKGYARAMQINPLISAYMGAGLERYGYRNHSNEELYNIMLQYQPDFASGFGPGFYEFEGLGIAFYSEGQRRAIYIQLTDDDDVLKTLFHELFHTVYKNLPSQVVNALENFGRSVREANQREPAHEDRRSPEWINRPEEAEAFAFERYATGNAPPFGLALPPPVRATFRDVLRGDYAHHRVRT